MKYIVIYQETYAYDSFCDKTDTTISYITSKDELTKKVLELKNRGVEFEVFEKIIPSL